MTLSFLRSACIAAFFSATAAAGATQFQVTLPSSQTAPVSGRLLVFATAIAAGQPLPASVDTASYEPPGSVTVAAQEVASWSPGQTVTLDADGTAYPTAFKDLPPGRYAVQIVLDRDHSYAGNGRGAGDLVSRVVAMDLPQGGAIALTETLPPADPWQLPAAAPAQVLADTAAARPFIRPFNVASKALTAFQGRPVALKGYVVLPPDYDANKQRYPVVHWFPGFGGPPYNLTAFAVRFQRMMARKEIPPMIWVVNDMHAPTGPTEFTDSVNTGPCGTAFTQELVPYLDRTYRTEARAGARFLTGHSSGGWASLMLQVTYPQLFGGSWSTSPDPVDFHAFVNADLYAPGANVYRAADGTPLPLTRDGKSTKAVSFESAARMERVLGAYGGQNSAFDWVFSPRGEDGRPQPLFDPVSGAVDPQVAQYWHDHDDVAAAVARLAPGERRKLAGKLHVWVGAQDSFYLDRAAVRFAESSNRLGLDVKLTVVSGRDHFDLYTDGTDRLGLFKVIARQMEAVRAAR
jgi:hypothetical protein